MKCLVRYKESDDWLPAQLSDLTPTTAVLSLEKIGGFTAVVSIQVADINIESKIVYSNVSEKVCVVAFDEAAVDYKQLKSIAEPTIGGRSEGALSDETREPTEQRAPFDLAENQTEHCFTDDLVLEDHADETSTRETIAAPPPVKLDENESTDTNIESSSDELVIPNENSRTVMGESLSEIEARQETFAESPESSELFEALTMNSDREKTDALIQSDALQSIRQSGHDLEVQLRRPSVFSLAPPPNDEVGTAENEIAVSEQGDDSSSEDASLGDASCLPVFLDDDSLVLFQTNEQFLWHYDRHIRNCGLVVEASGLALGSKQNLGLTILGTEIMVRIQAQVCYVEGPTVGFMLPDDNEHKAMMRGVVHLCRP